MKEKKLLLKNTIIILVGKICTQFLSFILLPIYTSYLISSEFGFVDLVITYVSLLVPVLSLQLEMATFRMLIDSRSDLTKQSKIISTDLFSVLFFSLIIIIITVPLSILFSIKYIWLISLIIIANILSSNLLQISRGNGDNLSFSISSVITGLSTLLLNILFIVYFGFGAFGMLLSMLIANCLCSIFLIIKLKIKDKFSYNLFDLTLFKKMIKYSMPLIPNGISWWIMNASDRTIISIFLSISSNGIYAISNKFPSLLTSFFGIFNLAWSESAAINYSSNNKNKYYSSVCNDIVKIFGMCGIIILVLMPFLFPLLINSKYNEAYLYIPILLVSSFFSLMAAQYGSIYIAAKETKKLAITTFISALINIIVNLLFIKKFGLYAAAFSTAISYCIIMFYRHYDTKKYVSIKYEKKNFVFLFMLLIFSLISYYICNIILNVFALITAIIISILFEKEYIELFIKYLKIRIKGDFHGEEKQ